jgi:hypothetical protein
MKIRKRLYFNLYKKSRDLNPGIFYFSQDVDSLLPVRVFL